MAMTSEGENRPSSFNTSAPPKSDDTVVTNTAPVETSTNARPTSCSAAQAEQSCRNIGAILEAAGLDFSKVIKTVCFLADMGDFAAFNAVYEKFFVSKPARSCVAVKQLPKGVLCEIEAIAAAD